MYTNYNNIHCKIYFSYNYYISNYYIICIKSLCTIYTSNNTISKLDKYKDFWHELHMIGKNIHWYYSTVKYNK